MNTYKEAYEYMIKHKGLPDDLGINIGHMKAMHQQPLLARRHISTDSAGR